MTILFVDQNIYKFISVEIFFTGCTTDGPSMYRIFDDNVSWITAKVNTFIFDRSVAIQERYSDIFCKEHE